MYKIIENHPNDSRVKFREDNVFQTLSSRCGTGGGNVPMVMNIEGVGVNENIAGTLDANYFKGCGVRGGTERTAVCVGNGQLDQVKPTKMARTLNCMHDQQCVMENKTVRRLTPIECERLQGWPEEDYFLAFDLKNESVVLITCVDFQENHVQFVAAQCRKKQKLAGIVEKIKSQNNVLSAEKCLHLNNQNNSRPAQKNVHTNCEGNIQVQHNFWEKIKNVFNAEKSLRLDYHETENSVPQNVPMNTTKEKEILNGKAELQKKESLQKHEELGMNVLSEFGNAIMEYAKTAVKSMRAREENLQYTIYDLSAAIENQDLKSKILSFFAQNVTHLYIPTKEEIAVLLLGRRGYTDIPCNGRPASDSARYKALGNGMAQPCARYIIAQIAKHA